MGKGKRIRQNPLIPVHILPTVTLKVGKSPAPRWGSANSQIPRLLQRWGRTSTGVTWPSSGPACLQRGEAHHLLKQRVSNGESSGTGRKNQSDQGTKPMQAEGPFVILTGMDL